MKYFFYYETPFGKIKITEENDELIELFFCDTEVRGENIKPNAKLKETAFLKEVKRQIDEYFNKERQTFDIPLKLNGSEFQKSVWNALMKIPYGTTTSYGAIGEMLNIQKSGRAVGFANKRNPVLIIVPCHRVIGAKGNLVGYRAGSSIKEALIRLERENTNPIP